MSLSETGDGRYTARDPSRTPAFYVPALGSTEFDLANISYWSSVISQAKPAVNKKSYRGEEIFRAEPGAN